MNPYRKFQETVKVEDTKKYWAQRPKTNKLRADGRMGEYGFGESYDFDLKELSKVLKSTNAIQSFYMNCPKGAEELSEVRFQYLNLRIRALTSLKSLRVHLSGYISRWGEGDIKITDEAMDNFGKALRHLARLRELCLNFKHCHKLTDAALNSLGQALKRLKGLESFDLNIGGYFT